MEYLDVYDEEKNYIGTYPRDYVHENALWHNTVHCWLYDKEGNIYFQIRSDEKTFYTTASGHVLANESIKEAFGREIKEEIGIDVHYEKAVLVGVVTWKMDKIKKDGTKFLDRVFAHVNVLEFDEKNVEFQFDTNEVLGVIKVNAKETLDLFKKGNGEIPAELITTENGSNKRLKRNVNIEEFLVTEGETALTKYKDVLEKVIALTS